jgi:hypothetical protein
LRDLVGQGAWPRGCGLNESESTKLSNFLKAAEGHPATKASVPYAMATTASDFMRGFESRCAGLNNDTIPGLSSQAANEKSLADLLSAAGNWYVGLNNSLANRYATSSEPLAKTLAEAWAKA